MKKRICIWLVLLAVAVGYIAFNEYQKNLPEETETESEATGKETMLIYNDVGSESVVSKVFNETSLASKYNAEFTSKSSKANCVLTEDVSLVDDKDKTIATSYTPLIIGMKNADKLEKYKESGLLTFSEEENSTNNEISIDFKKLIDAVVNGENWSSFGGEEKSFRIIIPEEDDNSIERDLFYNFLLVTINNGSYPTNDEALEDAKKTADSFLESSCCIETENAINDLKQISSINATDIYILFEADFVNSSIWSQRKLDLCIAYPNVTVIKHIYMQAPEESSDEFTKFFYALSEDINYRDIDTKFFTENKNYNVKDEMTSFVEIPEVEESDDGVIFIVIIIFIIILGGVVSVVLASEW